MMQGGWWWGWRWRWRFPFSDLSSKFCLKHVSLAGKNPIVSFTRTRTHTSYICIYTPRKVVFDPRSLALGNTVFFFTVYMNTCPHPHTYIQAHSHTRSRLDQRDPWKEEAQRQGFSLPLYFTLKEYLLWRSTMKRDVSFTNIKKKLNVGWVTGAFV